MRALIERFHGQTVKPLLCVIGEPTELKPVLGHKGKYRCCDVHGGVPFGLCAFGGECH